MMLRRPPHVSVVLPTRDRARLVGRAIDSVRGQTFEDLELIVIDDGSTDDTGEVVARYAAADRRIRLERAAVSAGAAAARNLGIARSRGSFVAFMDDDVVWRPSKLERQLRAFQADPEIGLVYCSLVRFDATGEPHRIGSAAATGGGAHRALLRRNFIGTACAVVRSDLLGRVRGFDERLPRLQDWDLWLRLAEATRFAFDPAPLVEVPHIPGGISSDPDALIEACGQLAAKFSPRLGRKERGIWLSTLGHTLLTNGVPAEGRRLLWRAWRASPLAPRCACFAVASLLGTRAYVRIAEVRARRSEMRLQRPGIADVPDSIRSREASAAASRPADGTSNAVKSSEVWPS